MALPPQIAGIQQAVFLNGDFEDDNIGLAPSGWTVIRARNPGVTRSTPQTYAGLNLQTGSGQAQTFVVGGATESQPDPDLTSSAPVRFPKYGLRAARVNYLDNSSALNEGASQNANILEQTATMSVGDVDPTDGKIHLRFGVLPVLENPNHADDEQPYYYVHVHNDTRNVDLYRDFNTSGQPGVPWKMVGSTFYTDWQLVDVSPGDAQLRIGDQVTVRVVAAGCSLGGHWGRVYLDAVGTGIPGLYAWATAAQAVNAGSDLTYTVNYKNGSNVVTSGTTFKMPIPTDTTYVSSTQAGCSVGGSPAVLSCPLGALSQGAVGQFKVTVNVGAGTMNGAIITNGSYTIEATGVSALIGPRVETTVTNGVTYADVSVSQTDGNAAVSWGQAVTYTVRVANAGPSAAASVTVTDTIPAQLTGATWTCAGSGGGTCGASGSGNISDVASLPSGAEVVYTVSAMVVAGSGNGSVGHVVSAAVGGGVSDPDSSNNTAVDTDTIGAVANLTLTKNLGGSGDGTVRSTPAAIDCGTACAGDTKGFSDGSQVMLTAFPNSGTYFLGWGGGCAGTASSCTLTMSGAQSVTATFTSLVLAADSGSGQRAATGGDFATPLKVRVMDGSTPAAGVTVNFSAPSSGASTSVTSSTTTTDAMGYASFTPRANATAGDYVVTASSPAATGTAAFNLGNRIPSTIAVVSGNNQSTTVGGAFAAPLLVEVRDASNQVLPGVAVTFTAPGSGATATPSPASAGTDVSGRASVGATAGTRPGAYMITATAGSISTTFSATNVVGAAASLVGNGAQSTTVRTAFAPLLVTVLDAYGNRVPNVPVTFTAPSSGATAVLAGSAPVVTDSNGVVTLGATANQIAGTYIVEARAPGVTTPASFSLTNTSSAATTATISAGNSQSATVLTAFGTPLTVLVRDADANPIPGVMVTFSAPMGNASATLSTASATTDAQGLASVTASARSAQGSYVVTATVAGVPTPLSFALTNVPGAPATIAVESGSGQSAAVTAPFAQFLVAHVRDGQGNDVPGVAVTFTAPASGASAQLGGGTATTDAGGLASLPATANNRTGTYMVSARVGSLATAFTLTNSAGAIGALAVRGGGGQSTVVDSAFPAALVVEVLDNLGNPVPNLLVTFTPPAGPATALLSQRSALTDASGRASVNARSSTAIGSYVVSASAAGFSTAATFALTNTAGPAVRIAALSGGGQTAQVLTAFDTTLVAAVYDRYDNAVPGATVTFAVPGSGATVALAGSNPVTDAAGRVSVGGTAGASVGSYVVTASVAGGFSPVTFALSNQAGPPGTISVLGGGAQTTRVGTNFGAPLRVRVADAMGNPVPNAQVTFTAPASGASAVLSGTTVSTDVAGEAQVTATASTVAGTFNVGAIAPGVASGVSFALTNQAGTAAALDLTAGAGQTTQIGTPFAAALVATVRDAFGNLVPGEPVTFAAPGAGASATLSAPVATSDAQGRASIAATASGTAGSYAVSAQLASGPSAGFALTNIAGTPGTIVVRMGPDQRTAVRTAYPMPLRIVVVDARNNPVPNVTVSFVAPARGASATLDATSVTTDAGGEASVNATAGDVAGTFTVSATAPGTAGPASIALTNLPGNPVRLERVGGDGQSATVATAFRGPLAVIAYDALDNPVPSRQVAYVAPGSGASAVLYAGSLVTNAQGRAELPVAANAVAGSYEVTATLTGIAPARFTLTNLAGAVGTIEITGGVGQSAVVGTNFAQPLAVRVRDSNGNAVAGVTVTFDAPDQEPSAQTPPTAVTDAAGNASVTARAGDRAGSYVVTASAPGAASPVTFALQNRSATPAAIVVLSGTPQTARVGASFGEPLRVAVRDAKGNAVAGVVVTFAPPGAGASARLIPAGGTTDLAGHVTVTAIAGLTAGNYQVTASAPGVSQPAAFALSNVAGAATRLVRLGGDGQQTATGAAFPTPLSVAARDDAGNPIAGALVQFEAPTVGASATLAQGSVASGSDGTASVSAVANARTGSYQVTATLTGTSQRVTFALVNVAGACAGESICDDDDGDGVRNEDDPAAGDPCVPSRTIPQCATGDADRDGIPNDVECPSPALCPDSDGDHTPDYLDTDSDNDGRLDTVECTSPRACLDADQDGLADYVESEVIDTDGDGMRDQFDTDSDGDGLPDSLEGRDRPWPDPDGDHIPSHLDGDEEGPGAGDSDGDGVLDDVECPTGYVCVDSDRDGVPDYFDLDSDNDGVPDASDPARTNPCTPSIEAKACVSPGFAIDDMDGDGLPDVRECAVDPALEARFARARPRIGGCPDTDGDGIPDDVDSDSDGDGLSDRDECPLASACPDANGNGIPDYLEPAPIKVAGGACALGRSQLDVSWLCLLGLLGLRVRRRRRDEAREQGGVR